MAAIDDLRAAVADLTTAAQEEHAELDAVVGELGTVEGQLAQLQTQIAQGGSVSEADLAAVTQSVTGIAAAARQAVESAKANAGAAPAGGGAPPGGGTSPVAPAGPAAPPEPAAPAGGSSGPSTAQSVYVFGGDVSTVDTTVWPAANVETAEPQPRPLFHYSGDTAPGDTNGDGVGGIWHVYTGPTQPAGTGAAGGAGAEG